MSPGSLGLVDPEGLKEKGEWQVDVSRPPTQIEGPFSPLMFQAPPLIPKIYELDIAGKRRALIAHIVIIIANDS